MIDIVRQLNATHRELGEAPLADGPGRSLLLRRTYDAAAEDVWDACTDPVRLGRWLAPVSGDLRPGGTFQLEGNAGGRILRCEPPALLKVTWELGEGMATEVELRLAPDGDGTALELEHAAPAAITDELVRQYGPGGTIGIGGGWDLALLGLDRHLAGADLDPATWQDDPQVARFAAGSCAAWGEAVRAAWGTPEADVAAGVAFAAAHFTPRGA